MVCNTACKVERILGVAMGKAKLRRHVKGLPRRKKDKGLT